MISKIKILEFSKFNVVTIISKFVAVFFLPFLTTILPKEEIGLISIYTRLIGLVSIVFGLGYFSQIIKIKDSLSLKKLINEFVKILLVGFTISLILFLIPNYGSFNIALIMITGVFLAGLTFFRNYYRLNSLTNKYLINEIIFIVTSVGFSLIFLYFFTNYISRIWGICLSYILTFIIYYKRFKMPNLKPYTSFSFFKNSISLLPHMILKWVRSRSDIVLLTLYFSASVISDYAIALSVSSLALVFYDAHNQFFLSSAKNNLQANEIKKWTKEIYKSVILYFLILIVLILSIDLIYSIFGWIDFENGKTYAKILSCLFFLKAISNLFTTYFNYFNLNYTLSKITFMISIIYLISGIISMHYFNIEIFLVSLILIELIVITIFKIIIDNGKHFN